MSKACESVAESRRYYAEGTIKKIVIEGDKIQFSLDPAAGFYDEFRSTKDKKIVRLVGEAKGSWLRYYEKELFASDISYDEIVSLAKHDNLPVRIYVEDGDLSKVKSLEIKE